MSKPSTDRSAITQIIKGIMAKGVTLDYVDDGGEDIKVQTVAEAVTAITDVDIATLYVNLPNGQSSFVYFVQGNDPEEVAADYGVSLSDYIEPITLPWWD